ncbi:MAG: hypothetical protein HY782_10555 [Chloroflexi bacterium]|nr:hypothetical protein [Chloroflexota bacterium]
MACAYQTHYCTYIRVPRLLTLQTPQSDAERLLITAFQWHELWLKVLLTDARAALADAGATFETTKLLRRGIALFKLLNMQLAFDESVLVRELQVGKTLRVWRGRYFSEQLAQLTRLSRRLRQLTRAAYPGLAETLAEYAAHLTAFRTRFQSFAKATFIPKKSHAPSYSEWLCLRELLSLQDGVKAAWTELGYAPTTLAAPEHISADESMFIIVHQCFELWFKVMLDHIDRAIPLITAGAISDATRLLRRVVDIQRLLVQQIQIPATMLPLDFARFRDERQARDGKVFQRGLSPASGTESYQFREIEIVCGLRDDPVFRKYLDGTEKLPIRLLTPRQTERLQQPTLLDAFQSAVSQRGIAKLDDLFTPANIPNPNADLAQLADTLIELDEQFRFWRLTHVSMVEKMIGGKSGTGFLGPEYLMETAGIKLQEKNRVFEDKQVRPRFFEELWQLRTRLGTY